MSRSIFLITASKLLERFVKSEISSGLPGAFVVWSSTAEAVEAAEREGAPAAIFLDYFVNGLDARQMVPALQSQAVLQGVPIILIFPPTVEDEAIELVRVFEGVEDAIGKPFNARGFLAVARRFLTPELPMSASVPAPISERPEVPAEDLAPPVQEVAPTPPDPTPLEDVPPARNADPAPLEPPPFEPVPPSLSIPVALPLPVMTAPPSRFDRIQQVPDLEGVFQWRAFGEIGRASNASLHAMSDSIAYCLQIVARLGNEAGLGDVQEMQIGGPANQVALFSLEGGTETDPGAATFGITTSSPVPIDELVRRARRACESTP